MKKPGQTVVTVTHILTRPTFKGNHIRQIIDVINTLEVDVMSIFKFNYNSKHCLNCAMCVL